MQISDSKQYRELLLVTQTCLPTSTLCPAGQIGQVHISEVGDSTSPALNPLQRYRLGQTVQAMVLHPGQKFPKSTPTSNKKPNRVELTLRLPDPNSKVDENKSLRSEFSDLRAGQERTG